MTNTTTDTRTPLQSAAIDAIVCFEPMQGTETFATFRLVDHAYQWVRDMVRKAHNDEIPGDWRYTMVRSVLDRIADGELTEDRERIHEFADGQAAIYTTALLRWYADDPSRLEYADRHAHEFGGDLEMFHRLHGGQFLAIEELTETVLSAVERHAETL